MSLTRIHISKETKEALQTLKTKNESYDSILQRLIKNHSWKTLDNEWNDILSRNKFLPFDEL